MTAIKSLRIILGQEPVASLFCTDDGRSYLHFDEAYINNPQRPILSYAFHDLDETITRAQLSKRTLRLSLGGGRGQLPPFFQNLLPEGQLRKHLIQRANLAPDDEFGLLAYCGKSLPGNVVALPETLTEQALGRLIGQGKDSYEMSSYQLPTPVAESLSGVQPKVALVKDGGRYVMRSKDSKGQHFIGKLPTSDYERLPEVEYASLLLAKAVGVDVCQAELTALSAISDTLPFSMRDDAQHFLLVHRFDRDAPTNTGRLHVEDFAQLLGVRPQNKYSGTYAAIGAALLDKSTEGEKDIFELLRRIKVNELLGNRDAHLKNFSMLYHTPHLARLAPAYDIVAYSAYYGGAGHALLFTPQQQERKLLTPAILRELSNIWELSETQMRAVLEETVDLAMQKWPEMLANLPFSAEQRSKVILGLHQNPSCVAWTMRRERIRLTSFD